MRVCGPRFRAANQIDVGAARAGDEIAVGKRRELTRSGYPGDRENRKTRGYGKAGCRTYENDRCRKKNQLG